MPASRYWRINAWQVPDAGAVLSAMWLYAGATRVDDAATLSCSHAPIAGALSALQDADLSTRCTFSAEAMRAPGFALVWDFGAAVEVTALRFAGGSAAAWPDLMTIEQLVNGAWTSPVLSLGGFPWPGVNALTAFIPVINALRAATVFELHFDGVNGSTSFVDDAPAPLTQNLVGSVALSTARAKYGSTSANFDATGVLKLGGVGDAAIAPGERDFCFEAWAYDTGTGNRRTLAANQNSGGGGLSILIGYIVDNVMSCRISNGVTECSINGIVAPLSRWYHLAFVRHGAALKVYIDGTVAGTIAIPAGFSVPAGAGRFALGSGGDYYNPGGPYGTNWIGHIDECRLVIGEPVYTQAFTPGPMPTTSVSFPFLAQRKGLCASAAQIVASAELGPSTMQALRALCAADVEFGGAGRIYGDTKIELAPNNEVPTKARVRIFRERDALLARETWSDTVTGAWSVEGLDPAQAFIALAQDAEGNYRAVAADRSTPEVTS